MSYLYSIVVPVYKAEKYLNKCIDSLLNQNYKNLEVILIDDGSPDKSGDICDYYKNRDDRVVVIHKENEGVGIARNVGISIAKGDYITFIDSDDWVSLNMLDTVNKELNKYPYDLLIWGYESVYIDTNNDVLKKQKNLPPKMKLFNQHDCRNSFFNLYKNANMNNPWNKMYKLSVIKNNSLNFSTMKRAQDALFNINYFSYVESLSTIHSINNFYRVNSIDALWTKFPQNYSEIQLIMYKEYLKKFEEWNIISPEIVEYFSSRLISYILFSITLCLNPDWSMDAREKYLYIKKIVRDPGLDLLFRYRNDFELGSNKTNIKSLLKNIATEIIKKKRVLILLFWVYLYSPKIKFSKHV